MILNIRKQRNTNPYLDIACDLCRRALVPSELIEININHDPKNTAFEKRQLTACPTCLGKLAKASQAFIGQLLVGIEDEEVIEL